MIGGLGPFSFRLVDSITPINGVISCAFMMLYGAGDFLVVFVNGELIQKFGAVIQPLPLSSYCAGIIPVLFMTILLHRRYQNIRSAIIGLTSLVMQNSEGTPQNPSPLPSPVTTPSV